MISNTVLRGGGAFVSASSVNGGTFLCFTVDQINVFSEPLDRNQILFTVMSMKGFE